MVDPWRTMVICQRVYRVLFLFLFLGSLTSVNAYEIRDGNIRLVLNERTGSYSLFYLTNPQTGRYEPLFNARERSASFSSIFIDGNIYRLGHRPFSTRIEIYNGSPAFVFESPTMIVTQVFTFIKTYNSFETNGVMISYTIQNTSDRNHIVGLRILIDTELTEGRRTSHFITNNRAISNETLVDPTTGEIFWISRSPRVALMGSIVNPLDDRAKVPDLVHFANWRRLYDSTWRLNYSAGRSFNGDSAVCYIYDPALLEIDESFQYSIFLTAEDVSWYNTIIEHHYIPEIPVVVTTRKVFDIEALIQEAYLEASATNQDVNLLILFKLQEVLNQFIDGEIDLDEHDLLQIDNTIERYR